MNTFIAVALCVAFPFLLTAAVVAFEAVTAPKAVGGFTSKDVDPTEVGWYEVRWWEANRAGELECITTYRGWDGMWWIPLLRGWVSAPYGKYEWRGPVADIHGPAPDGTNPKPKELL